MGLAATALTVVAAVLMVGGLKPKDLRQRLAGLVATPEQIVAHR